MTARSDILSPNVVHLPGGFVSLSGSFLPPNLSLLLLSDPSLPGLIVGQAKDVDVVGGGSSGNAAQEKQGCLPGLGGKYAAKVTPLPRDLPCAHPPAVLAVPWVF